MQVLDFLRSGGYRLAETAQSTALARRRSYRRNNGEIDYRRSFGDSSGFEAEEIHDKVLIRFVGPETEEVRALNGYALVLENCGFRVESGADPHHEGRQALRVLPKL